MDKERVVDLGKYQNRLGFRNKIGRALWFLAYWSFFRPFPGRIFRGWRNLILRMFGAKIRGNSYVSASARIWAPWNLEIDEACISYQTRVYSVDKIKIGRGSVVSHRAHLCSASHDIYSASHDLVTRPIIIEDQVWIATEAFIGPGVNISQGAVVGARAVVSKDVNSWTVVAGNPAKEINQRQIVR